MVNIVAPIVKKYKDVLVELFDKALNIIREIWTFICDTLGPYMFEAKMIFMDPTKTFWEKIKDTAKTWYDITFPYGIAVAIEDFWHDQLEKESKKYFKLFNEKYFQPFWTNTAVPFFKNTAWPMFKDWLKNNWKELLTAFGLAYLISNPFQALHIALNALQISVNLIKLAVTVA